MASVDELFPIFEKNRIPASASWDLTELESHIRERDYIEFLANRSINQPNSERLYLEPIPLELWKPLITKSDEEMEDVAPANENQLELLSIAQFEFLYESDDETKVLPKVPHAIVNIPEYQKRRENHKLFQLPQQNNATTSVPSIQHVVDNNANQTTIDQVPTSDQQSTADLTSPAAGASTAPSAAPSTVKRTPTATTLFANLYDASLMDTDMLSERAGPKIYAYPENIIPIFATPTQQSECDQNLNKDLRFYKVNYQHLMHVLGLPVADDIVESGKGLFIKSLLTNLQDRNLTLAFATADLNEECLLFDAAKHIGVRCDRFSNVLTDWESDYGIYIETKPVDPLAPSQRSFNKADFVICVGATIDGGTIQRLQATPQTPVAWMITLGSVEQRVFDFNTQHRKGYPEIANVEGFKELLQISNTWPAYDHYTCQELTTRVVNHVSGWLNRPVGPVYQFRSIEHLPLSYHFASFKVQAEEQVEDMDISSDVEDMHAVCQEIFPIYEIIKKAPITTTTAIVPQAILEEYEREAELVKEKYEIEFKSMLEKYKAKVAH